ncbi:hypothetical protein B2K_40045 [Paenibacillus mucilaginosus K02]|uniref:Uncharacterized protein n=1 Tax=Paenibacillus mucilaginosus K02 TaxID=997761 RepID=R9ULP5_9BACL|nr:hypothetical protein B2K_40045 [Paenibacillus mucilaginosus K02]
MLLEVARKAKADDPLKAEGEVIYIAGLLLEVAHQAEAAP